MPGMVGYMILIGTACGDWFLPTVWRLRLERPGNIRWARGSWQPSQDTNSRACIRFCVSGSFISLNLLLFLCDGLSKWIRDQGWQELSGEEMPAVQNIYIFLYKTSIKLFIEYIAFHL